jgi:tight adherence protein B
MSFAKLLAGAGGGLAVPALVELLGPVLKSAFAKALSPVRRVESWGERVRRPVRLARNEGALPTDSERLRLQVAAALTGFILGTAILGVKGGIAMSFALPWFALRLIAWHRGRYRRRLDEGAAAAALALADALAAGHSVRGALSFSGRGLEGPIGVELGAVGRELDLGGETEHVLERLRARARSRRVDLIVAAVRVQRRSGGSLATLLRRVATTLDDHDRLDAEARAATAQARFTSIVVLVLPLVGLLLAELAAPGVVSRMTSSAAGAWLLGAALALQGSGVFLIRRLSRLAT